MKMGRVCITARLRSLLRADVITHGALYYESAGRVFAQHITTVPYPVLPDPYITLMFCRKQP